MITPKKFAAYTQTLAKNLALAKTKEIAVGLPVSSSLSRKIYKKKGSKGGSKSLSVLDVGIMHEYGLGNNPVRSFLRVAFAKNSTKVESILRVSFKRIADGADTIMQMERAAIALRTISVMSFTNQGYGTWKNIKKSTAKQKGVADLTARLTDTATLKQSIIQVVRNATS